MLEYEEEGMGSLSLMLLASPGKKAVWGRLFPQATWKVTSDRSASGFLYVTLSNWIKTGKKKPNPKPKIKQTIFPRLKKHCLVLKNTVFFLVSFTSPVLFWSLRCHVSRLQSRRWVSRGFHWGRGGRVGGISISHWLQNPFMTSQGILVPWWAEPKETKERWCPRVVNELVCHCWVLTTLTGVTTDPRSHCPRTCT